MFSDILHTDRSIQGNIIFHIDSVICALKKKKNWFWDFFCMKSERRGKNVCIVFYIIIYIARFSEIKKIMGTF